MNELRVIQFGCFILTIIIAKMVYDGMIQPVIDIFGYGIMSPMIYAMDAGLIIGFLVSNYLVSYALQIKKQ